MLTTRNQFQHPTEERRKSYLRALTSEIEVLKKDNTLRNMMAVGFREDEIRRGGSLLRYVGHCPTCRTEQLFLQSPLKRKRLALANALQQIALIVLKPVASLTQMLSAHKNALPVYCAGCGSAFYVCPFCDECCGRVPVDVTQRVTCPNCSAVV